MTIPMPYTLTLTAEEYRSAEYMCARGYLGGLTEQATETETSEDETTVTLRFRESDIWPVCELYSGDENDLMDFWALTTPDTSLGRKVCELLDRVV
jgi:hypothetical protein